MTSMNKRLRAVLILCFTVFLISGCGGDGSTVDADGNIIPPASVAKVKNKTLSYVKSAAPSFNGKWANWHRDMIASGEGRDFERFEGQAEMLKVMKTQSGARNAYVIFTEDGADAETYKLSMDASVDGVRFGSPVDAKPAMRSAFAGQAAADAFAWNYKERDPCWSAFAPIYDGEGDIIAVLGIDYPAPTILSYPQWNRDDEQWNGVTE